MRSNGGSWNGQRARLRERVVGHCGGPCGVGVLGAAAAAPVHTTAASRPRVRSSHDGPLAGREPLGRERAQWYPSRPRNAAPRARRRRHARRGVRAHTPAGPYMSITQDQVVSIHYTLKDDAGEVIDTSGDGAPLTYLHGHGNLDPGSGARTDRQGRRRQAAGEDRPRRRLRRARPGAGAARAAARTEGGRRTYASACGCMHRPSRGRAP